MHGLTRILLCSIALISVMLAACTNESDEDAEARAGVNTVRVADNTFSPRALRVAPGATVTWVWKGGGARHDVAGDGFTSDVQSEGAFAHTFDASGSYDYRCRLHPEMTGRVLVEKR